MIERQQETIQSDCSINCGLRLMRKSTYHIRAWTHTREKPPLGGDLLHYPLLQVPPLKNATSPSPKSILNLLHILHILHILNLFCQVGAFARGICP